MFPKSKVVYDNVLMNKLYWERMRDLYKRRATMRSSLDIFDDEKLDEEVVNAVMQKCKKL